MKFSSRICLCSLLLLESCAAIPSNLWTGTTSQSWNISNNWSPTSVPNSGVDANFNNSAARYTVELDSSIQEANALNFTNQDYNLFSSSDSHVLNLTATDGSVINLTNASVTFDGFVTQVFQSGTISIDPSSNLLFKDLARLAAPTSNVNIDVVGGGNLNLKNFNSSDTEQPVVNFSVGTLTINNASVSVLNKTTYVNPVNLVAATNSSLANNFSGYVTPTSFLSFRNNASISNIGTVDALAQMAIQTQAIEIKDSASFYQYMGLFGEDFVNATISGGSISSYGTFSAPYEVVQSYFLSGGSTSNFLITGTPNIYLEATSAFSGNGTFSSGTITVKGLLQEEQQADGSVDYYPLGAICPDNFNMLDGASLHLIGGRFKGGLSGTFTMSGGTITLDYFFDSNNKFAPSFVNGGDRAEGELPYVMIMKNAAKVLNNSSKFLSAGTTDDRLMNLIMEDQALIVNNGTMIGGSIYNANIGPLSVDPDIEMRDQSQIVTNQYSSISIGKLKMTGGTINNNGLMISIYQLEGGAITGTGTMVCNIGFNEISQNATVTQSYVGFFETNKKNPVFLIVNGALNATQVDVSPNATIAGTGTINAANFVVKANGAVYPGIPVGDPGDLIPPFTGDLILSGNCLFKNKSVFKVDVVSNTVNSLTMPSGVMSVEPGAEMFVHMYGSYEGPKNLVVAEIPNNLTTLFTIKTDQPLLGYTLSVEDVPPPGLESRYQVGPPFYLVLNATRNPFTVLGGFPNQIAVEKALDKLFGNTNACLQKKMDEFVVDTKGLALTNIYDMQNSEFKAHQITLEELLFAVNDQFKPYLYTEHKGFRPFILGGYNYQKQPDHFQYLGYYSLSGYEFGGLTYGLDCCQLFGAIGSLQSNTRIKKKPSQAKSTSINSAFGVSSNSHRWYYGFDILGGYYWMHTKRHIDTYGLVASSHHNLWNFKTSMHGEYRKEYSLCEFSVYDDVTYYLGHENGYQESSAECLSLNVKDSNRQVIRNAFGIKGVFLKKERIQPYIDLAYVYEDRFSGTNYENRFVNTSPIMKIQGQDITRNFAKLNFGLSGTKNNSYFQFNFAGLYGERFVEQEFSISFDRKY